jgi:hypothetical protein
MPVSLPSKHRWRLYSLDFRLFFQTVRPVVAVRELQPRAVEREWSSLMSCRWLRVAFFDYAWLEDLWSGIPSESIADARTGTPMAVGSTIDRRGTGSVLFSCCHLTDLA